MKRLMILAVLLISGTIFSQNVTRVLEQDGANIKATYYTPSGTIQQEGYFKDGALTGKWISYNEAGNKISSGQYENGVKVGKWTYWTNSDVKEVEFIDNRIASVKSWQKDALANRN